MSRCVPLSSYGFFDTTASSWWLSATAASCLLLIFGLSVGSFMLRFGKGVTAFSVCVACCLCGLGFSLPLCPGSFGVRGHSGRSVISTFRILRLFDGVSLRDVLFFLKVSPERGRRLLEFRRFGRSSRVVFP